MSSAWRKKILYLKASKKKIQITDKFLDFIFSHNEKESEEFAIGTLAVSKECRTVKRRTREDTADPVFFICFGETFRKLTSHDEALESRESGEHSWRIDVRPVHAVSGSDWTRQVIERKSNLRSDEVDTRCSWICRRWIDGKANSSE